VQASSWQERGGAGDKTLFADQCTALARERDNSAQPVLLALVAAAPTLAFVTSLPAVVSHPGTEHSWTVTVLGPVWTVRVPLEGILATAAVTRTAGSWAVLVHFDSFVRVLLAVSSLIGTLSKEGTVVFTRWARWSAPFFNRYPLSTAALHLQPIFQIERFFLLAFLGKDLNGKSSEE